MRTFAPAIKTLHMTLGYGVIGNTTDSGPVILGSSPSTPTSSIAKELEDGTWRFLYG